MMNNDTLSIIRSAELNKIFSTFYILSTTEGYSGPCGGRFSGVEEHDSMLDALESQLEWLNGYDCDDIQKQNLEKAIENCQAKTPDPNFKPEFLTIKMAGRTEYTTHAAGYWDTFVLEALPIFKKDIEDELENFADGDEDAEVIEFHRQLALIDELMKYKNVRLNYFVENFLALKEDYGNRHC